MGIPKSQERKENAENREKNRELMKNKVMYLWNEGYRKSVIALKLELPESTVRSIIKGSVSQA